MAELIIGEHNYREFNGDGSGEVVHEGVTRKLACKSGKVVPGFVQLPPNFKAIPDNEVRSRAKDLQDAGADLLSTFRQSSLKVKNQSNLSYCHAFCSVSGVELTREVQGESYKELSPSFVGNMVTGFSNSGAYIEDDLKCIVEHGVPTVDFVPEVSLSRKWYDNNRDEVFANAALHKLDGWVNLGYKRQHGSLMKLVRTALLQRIPVVCALDWWSHAILYLNVHENGGVKFLNSWDVTFGDEGVGILDESRCDPDAAWIPASCLANL